MFPRELRTRRILLFRDERYYNALSDESELISKTEYGAQPIERITTIKIIEHFVGLYF